MSLDLFAYADLNGDGTLDMEELFVARDVRDAKMAIEGLLGRGAGDPVRNRDEFVKKMILDKGLDFFSTWESKQKNGVTPTVKGYDGPKNEAAEAVIQVIQQYRRFLPEHRDFYRRELAGHVTAPSLEEISDNAGQLQELSWWITNFARVSLCDGVPGISEAEYGSFLPFVRGAEAPSLNLGLTVAMSLDLSPFSESVTQATVAQKKQLDAIWSELATLPTGIFLLQKSLHIFQQKGFTVEILTPEQWTKKGIPESALAAVLRPENIICIRDELLVPIERPQLLESLTHELGHLILVGHGESVIEEATVEDLSQLVVWEGQLDAEAAAMMTDAARYETLWYLYSDKIYHNKDRAQIRAQEEAFHAGDLEPYIRAQRERIFAAAVKGCL